jgi:hypothetical protein
MWPIIFGALRVYAPYIVWPIAAVVGVVGYNIEKVLRKDQESPWRQSTSEVREERFLLEGEQHDPTEVDSLKKRTFIPKTIFERNK